VLPGCRRVGRRCVWRSLVAVRRGLRRHRHPGRRARAPRVPGAARADGVCGRMKQETQAAVDGVLAVDRLVHEPARLAILTVLSGAEQVEFGFLETVCRLSKGNLSSHLSKLEAAGLVRIEKTYRGRKPLTLAAITEDGRAALSGYRQQLAALVGGLPER